MWSSPWGKTDNSLSWRWEVFIVGHQEVSLPLYGMMLSSRTCRSASMENSHRSQQDPQFHGKDPIGSWEDAFHSLSQVGTRLLIWKELCLPLPQQREMRGKYIQAAVDKDILQAGADCQVRNSLLKHQLLHFLNRKEVKEGREKKAPLWERQPAAGSRSFSRLLKQQCWVESLLLAYVFSSSSFTKAMRVKLPFPTKFYLKSVSRGV